MDFIKSRKNIEAQVISVNDRSARFKTIIILKFPTKIKTIVIYAGIGSCSGYKKLGATAILRIVRRVFGEDLLSVYFAYSDFTTSLYDSHEGEYVLLGRAYIDCRNCGILKKPVSEVLEYLLASPYCSTTETCIRAVWKEYYDLL